MGTLFSALSIGQLGMRAAQVQLDTTAHNIANVNTEGYSRQRVRQTPPLPNFLPEGPVGRGVLIEDIHRVRDGFLDAAVRTEFASLGFAESRAQFLSLLEATFHEPGPDGFGTQFDSFFSVLNDFANNVESYPVREALASEADNLAGNLRDLVGRIDQVRTNANDDVKHLTNQLNQLTAELHEVNVRIRDAELNGTQANDLRDERDRIIDELSHLAEIDTVEVRNGEIHVLIGSDILVDAIGAREVEAVRNAALDPERDDFVELRFADNGTLVPINGGEIGGALDIRDNVVPEIDARLDELAASLIREFNSIQSQGNGISYLSGTVTSANEVAAPTDPLVSAGLPFPVMPGTFDVVVYDGAGTPTTTAITVAAGTTLNDLATQLNGVANFSASVNGNQLDLGPAAGFTFSLANDSTGVLPALGVNTFFNGTDARTIALNQDLQNDPGLIASSFSDDPLNTGDNQAALAMADLRNQLVVDGNSATFSGWYDSTVTNLAIETGSNQKTLETQVMFTADLERRRQEISGVSLDEEVSNLILFQRAFEASARIITVADRMLETLINVAR